MNRHSVHLCCDLDLAGQARGWLFFRCHIEHLLFIFVAVSYRFLPLAFYDDVTCAAGADAAAVAINAWYGVFRGDLHEGFARADLGFVLEAIMCRKNDLSHACFPDL